MAKRVQDEIERLVRLVRHERKRQMLAAVYSLWRVGDGVRRLRGLVGPGQWGTALETCGAEGGVHPSSLDEAARAARAFGIGDRRALCTRFESASTDLTPSHAIELARAPTETRATAIEALVRKPYTVRELRRLLRRSVP